MASGLDGNPDPLRSAARSRALGEVADEIFRRRRTLANGVLCVAVDGIDGAGKSTLADELAADLRRRGVPVLRSTTDSFHHRREVRWAKGVLSPEGFYRDSHDLPRLRELLLDPLTDRPTRPYRAAAFDEPSNAPVDAPSEVAPDAAVLLFDGLFLQREELRHYWDFSIWVDGEHRVTADRTRWASERCPAGPWGLVAMASSWAILGRYVGGLRLYIDECRPAEHADVVIDNNDLLAPSLAWRG